VGTDRPPVLVILGPTATGKTEVAIEVARLIDGEIISADSRAFFAGLDVTTAKPTPHERADIPHHLIDRVPLDGEYDAMSFRRDVKRLVPQIVGRGRVPILVGGGTVYLGAILRGIFEGPAKDRSFRKRMEGIPTDQLHRRLSAVDPDAARAIHENDRLRIVRALEVYESTGRPISAWQREAEPLPYDFRVFGLKRDRDDQRRAIASRVDAMLEAGLVSEIARLREEGLLSDRVQAFRTVGVKEVFGYLDGKLTGDQLREEIVRRTRSLAKRQTAWFKREKNVVWIDVTGRSATEVASEIIRGWEKSDRPKDRNTSS